ncbi:MAG: enoyl-CoA hydratase-related protein [Alphaproteobacteria bacterium]
MSGTVRYERKGDVGLIQIDRPPVNAIDVTIREGIWKGARRAAADPAVKVILIACAGRTFLSGADLKELEDISKPGGTIQTPELLRHARQDRGFAETRRRGVARHGDGRRRRNGGWRAIIASPSRTPRWECRKSPLVYSRRRRHATPAAPGRRARGDGDARGRRAVDAAKAREIGLIDAIVEGSPVESWFDLCAKTRCSRRSAAPHW